MVKMHTAVESAFKEYGTLKPFYSRSFIIGCHSGMHNIIKGLFIILICKQKFRKHTFLKHSVGRVDSVAYERLELMLQPVGGAHESFCRSIAVVHLDAALLQESADIALARAYSASYCYLHIYIL